MPEEETTVIKLEGKYLGWEATMLADPPWGYLSEMTSGSYERISAALISCLRGWNFRDSRGNPVDATLDGLQLVPRKAVLQLMNRYGDEYRALPND